MAERSLTVKQESFIAAYLGQANGNATEAARIAGYKKPAEQGYENLRKPQIATRVKEHVASKYATADAVLSELTDVAMAEWHEYVTIRRNPKTGDIIDVKMDLTNKVKALELLGKHHQLFVERQEVNVNIRRHEVIGVPQPALDAMFRATDRAEA